MSKPDWYEDAPKWAEWLAQDSDGSWHWYEFRPTYEEDVFLWIAPGVGKWKFASGGAVNFKWKETLERRP